MRPFAAAVLLSACATAPAGSAPPSPPPEAASHHASAARSLEHYVGRVGLDAYRAHSGAYPTTAQGLRALFERPAGAGAWNGPYLDGRPPILDPWGTEFAYESDGCSYKLVSAGPDRRFGTDDDIGGGP